MKRKNLLKSNLLFILIILISGCGSFKRASTTEVNTEIEEKITSALSKRFDSLRIETDYLINDSLFDVNLVITKIEFESIINPKDSSIISLPKSETRSEVKVSERVTREKGSSLSEFNRLEINDTINVVRNEDIEFYSDNKIERKESQSPKYLFWSILILAAAFIYIKIKGIL